tara:strand:- start:8 stop:802 length:795 start_codon:yes stop_codon:yes gene_type:complete
MQIFLTGASGQIGSEFRKLLTVRNLPVILLSRKSLSLLKNETFRKYELGDVLEDLVGVPEKILVHLAHDYSDRDATEKNINVTGMRRLLEVGFDRIIFVSTPVLKRENLTVYQRQKQLLEKNLVSANALIIKPSFIYSAKGGANSILNFLKKLKIPVIIPPNTNKLSPIKVEDFAKFLIANTIDTFDKKIILVKGQNAMNFKQFLENYHKIRTFYIHIVFFNIILFFLKSVKIGPTFYLKERMEGICNIDDIDDLSTTYETEIL